MTHQPRYQGTGGENETPARQPLTARQRWGRVALIAVVAALLLAMVVLHITGTFGPGMNG